jgi:hypothetical protein
MLDTFGMQQGGTQYRRLMGAFERIFGATIFFGTDTQRERAAVIHRARFNFMSEARIWYARDSAQDTLPGELQNQIVLSEEFFREIMEHPIPTDMEAAKALSCSPAALDLFTWLSYRCFIAKGRECVPLFGESGLVNQLGSSDYSRPRKFRERLAGWLDLVRALWPECPARISEDATGLWVDRANAVLTQEGSMYTTFNERIIWRVSLARIEQVVAAHLGPGRVPGNTAGPCFSRQVSMYLAKHVGHWSLSQIGKFYNGRHHTTVLHATEKIEALRKADEAVDALLDVLTAALSPESNAEARTAQPPTPVPQAGRSSLIDAITSRVLERLAEMQLGSVPKMVHTEV